MPAWLAPGQALYVQTSAAAELRLPDSAHQIHYYHQDHLGSSNAVTDAAGNLVEESVFYPFGHLRHQYRPPAAFSVPGEPYLFTQKERDKESELYYYGARYYEAITGKFISSDPLYTELNLLSEKEVSRFLQNPQQLNFYAYVLNNPIRYNDPSGLDAWDRVLGVLQAVGGVAEAAAGSTAFVAGAVGTVGTGPLGLSVAAGGAVLVAHGADTAAAGLRQAWTGSPTPTLTAQTLGEPVDLALGVVGPGLVSRSVTLARAGSIVPQGISTAPTKGTKVYRVYGENNNPLGQSWTTVDPSTVPNYRDAAGLPDVNTGRFVIEGTIINPTGITTRKALPLDGNKGGLAEILIPDAKTQVHIDHVSGVNPEF
jgi:RHS repeat-associated protein